MVRAYWGNTERIKYNSSSEDVTFTLRNNYRKDFKLFGKNALVRMLKEIFLFSSVT